MAWKFRKSIKVGPVRINLSQSGVGGSIGVKGFRKGVDAKGRQYTHKSIPGTGIYSREYQSSKVSLDDRDYDRKELNGRGKFAALFFLLMFGFIWFAGESLLFALLIVIPAIFVSGVFRDKNNYDYYAYGKEKSDDELEIDRLENELRQLEELEVSEMKSPFHFFGLNESCNRKELDKAFKNKIKMYHPDRVAALGPELQELAKEKTREIITNYEKCAEILQKRQSA